MRRIILYAIVETGGKQYQVSEGVKVRVDHLKTPIGNLIEIKEVKMVQNEESILIGEVLKNAKVEALVLNHPKGKKIIAFKYKRRKDYRRKVGHRQLYTELLVKKITY